MFHLPLDIDLNTTSILLQLNKANYRIGQLDGALKLLPNPSIILNAITIGEAKISSEIENIITTYHEIYESITSENSNKNAKEVLNYKDAINLAHEIVIKKQMLTTNDMVAIHHVIEPNKGAIRNQAGTVLRNERTKEVIHTPPQNEKEIRDYLENLEKYINEKSSYDPLIDMALIHYQFEAIHPFFDGNGRTGRVLNVAFLTLKEKISLPVLYLSKYIINHKEDYYSLISKVQEDKKNIVYFVQYMLQAVEETAIFTIEFIDAVNESMDETYRLLGEQLPKRQSKELVEVLYYDFITKNEYFRENLSISRNTATTILKELTSIGILKEQTVGKEVWYRNIRLMELMEQW
ncbi:Fic family protein [Erysipelothrix urinaevulpis]|uniref:Fic family protein n=1 Tax=Erysipelothrix urinaevulpis TaxID=2683717 RepID=UPI00135B80CD|nr:Fic/DOC family N-terminal domain-containing protein [Erysipelothrix urinaevulpis]